MRAAHNCPKCKSHNISIGYPDICCQSCGYSEPLIDYPISYARHRYHCYESNAYDPGPLDYSDKPPEPQPGAEQEPEGVIEPPPLPVLSPKEIQAKSPFTVEL